MVQQSNHHPTRTWFRADYHRQGAGISFQERENALQPLHQGASTRQGEGLGMGLSLVRAISELLYVDLSLSDGPNGRGLRVTVSLARFRDL